MLVTERGSRTPGFAGAPLRPPPPPPPAPAELITYESMGGPSYPNNNAVPGLMWPGFILPGEPVPESAPVSDEWTFTGYYTCIYPQHIDATTEFTLTARPGGSYNINPVGGDPGVTEPPGDGRWIASPA